MMLAVCFSLPYTPILLLPSTIRQQILRFFDIERSVQLSTNAFSRRQKDSARFRLAKVTWNQTQQHVWCESFLPLNDQSSLQLVVMPSRQDDVEKDVRCYANAVPSHADRQQGASMKRQDLIVLH